MQLEPFSVRVPASSANLGPGFDAVAIALDLYMCATVVQADAFAIGFVENGNEPTHDGLRGIIVEAMQRVNPNLPTVHVSIENSIPLGKGLGSSAAARVLGLVVATRCARREVNLDRIAREAAALEGHPDNAAAAVFGGMVIAESSELACVRIPAGDLRAVVVVPEFDLSTHSARALLPLSYARADVAFTAQHAALLGAALASSSWDVLRTAMRDRVHQPYRAPSVPGLAEALAVKSRELIGSALSGAGPSVLALFAPESDREATTMLLQDSFARAGVASRAYDLQLAPSGVDLR